MRDVRRTNSSICTSPNPNTALRVRPSSGSIQCAGIASYPLNAPAHDPAVAPIESKTGQLRYMPLAHPELFPKKGTVVVSYSNNDADLDRVIDDPLRYRPKFLRIALPEGPTRP